MLCLVTFLKSIVNSSRFNLSSSLTRQPGSIPRSTSAPKIMSPLIPEKQSKYAIVNLFFPSLVEKSCGEAMS